MHASQTCGPVVGPQKNRRTRQLDRQHAARTCGPFRRPALGPLDVTCGADLRARGGPAVMSSVLKGTNSCKDSVPKTVRDQKPRTPGPNRKRLGSSQRPLLEEMKNAAAAWPARGLELWADGGWV